MNYGYFDEKNREYVITRPDTPAPWANYLGSPQYGAIVTSNAGGYSFVESGAHGRLIRYRFNYFDEPGRYMYIRDDDTGDFWSASWLPVMKDTNEYKVVCKHGTSYTNIEADYSGISSEALYYVPLGKTHEVWRLKVRNNSDKARTLSLYGYVELSNDSHYLQDQVNLQYTQFISKTYFKGDMLLQTINESWKKNPDTGSNHMERFFGMKGAEVVSYNGDRDAFLGEYRHYRNPVAVEKGECNNRLNYNANSCGALHTRVTLQPGEEKTIAFFMGQHTEAESKEILNSYSDINVTDNELAELKNYWHSKLDNFKVKTPDENFNSMVNTWNAFQCFINFVWSRAASLTYCGERNGFGYRDTVQDIQGIIHLDPEMALKQIRFMLSAQINNGGGLPLVKYKHNPGHEKPPVDIIYGGGYEESSEYRADDALWLFPTVYKYIAQTGNIAFLDEVIPFANEGSASVYEHLKLAIDFNMKRLGAHNMPAGLHADWNDCLGMGKKGESTFVAMQLHLAMNIIREFSNYKNDAEYINYLDEVQPVLYNNIQKFCWESDRFIRGIREDGIVVGSKHDPEASMWLNPQSWGVISGISTKEQAEKSLDSTEKILNTEYGLMLLSPPYEKHYFDGAYMALFNPSTKENGGIFSQSQGWIILAEALAGNGDRAFKYYTEICPATMNDKAEIRRIEPYVHGQFVESRISPYEGRAHVHWLTGTASTVMVASVEGILGLRPDIEGIKISPAIPKEWDKIEIKTIFRNKTLNIKVKNKQKSGKVQNFILNGKNIDGDYVKADTLDEYNDIEIVM